MPKRVGKDRFRRKHDSYLEFVDRETESLEPMRLVKRVPKTEPKPGMGSTRLLRAQVDELAIAVDAEAKARLAKRSFADFFRQGWHVLESDVPLAWNWHIAAICDHLQWLYRDWDRSKRDPDFVAPVRNLLVNVPPGTAKSRITNVFFPAWIWLHKPSFSVRCVSGTPEVVNRDALLCRDLVQSTWYRNTFKPKGGLDEDQSAKTNFRTTAGGWRIAKGATGKVTGGRTDAILIDDPNDAKEIHSEIIRHNVKVSYGAYRNRVNNPEHAFRVLIMQRLHEDDLSGHVLSVGGWEHLRLPQLYEPNGGGCKCPTCTRGETWINWKDPRTEDGELLHPARYPQHVLDEERAQGEYYFAGQHQQRPAPSDGGVFKRDWWKRFDLVPPDNAGPSFRLGMSDDELKSIKPWDSVRPDLKLLTLSIDASMGTKNETSDYNALLVIGRRGAERYVLDNITRKMNLNETLEAIKFLRARWGKRMVEVLIELKANGQSIVDSLKNAGVSGVLGFDPKRDNKVARAHAIEPFVRAGDVYLPKDGPWVDSFLHELSVFPNGAHDDQVDALSQALIHMHAGGSLADFVAAFGK